MVIKLLVFDLDQVIVNTGRIHFDALNASLKRISPQFMISQDEDETIYGSLTTKDKLKLLTQLKNLPAEKHEEILSFKRTATEFFFQSYKLNEYFNLSTKEVIDNLRKNGYLIYLASNTNKAFINLVLSKIDVKFDKIFSNSDTSRPKPSSEIYLKAMLEAGAEPHETLIFEDSIEGQTAAFNAGAHLYPVERAGEFNYEEIVAFINNLSNKIIKYKSNKINVIIPSAGLGSRFVQAGYSLPKPLIDVRGAPMILQVIKDLNLDANYIFIIKEEHDQQYNMSAMLRLMVPDCQIVQVSGKQTGAATTILAAEHLIDNDHHLFIVNSDNGWDWNAKQFYHSNIQNQCDGCITVFEEPSMDPRWSFAKIDEQGKVLEVAEKKPISTLATAGSYWFNKGSDFVKYAKQMVEQKLTVNGEYYVAPVYNLMIQEDKYIKTFNIDKFWGMGTPEELQYYLNNRK